METEIINNLDNPKHLEKMYRENHNAFKREFNRIYEKIKEHKTALIWNERLNYGSDEISWGSNKELFFVIITAFIAGCIAKIPHFTNISEDYFYPRNISFIVFPALAAYFAWKQKNGIKPLVVISCAVLLSVLYINFLPANYESDTLLLACIHLPLFMWAILGFAFTGGDFKNLNKRLDFLRYNGDLVVMTAIILIAGGLMTGITMGLFELIKIRIEDFYFKYVVIWGVAAAPIIGTYLVRSNPQLVSKVSPIIAKVFSPLVLTTLVIYLSAIIYSGKDPYNDREFLLIFNVLLIGVMAIILFSVAETKNSNSKIGTVILFALSAVTIVVNGIALSAIVFRISEWGITPNRIAVLGGNVLILTNLLIVSYRLFRTFKNVKEVNSAEKSIASFLPVYAIWTIIVVFVFPLIFGFK
ncbi:MAG: rane protein [Bacteroidota bacterium]|jgi:hypothetical protein|nr:rane protein [Bacteroidota bacterium]